MIALDKTYIYMVMGQYILDGGVGRMIASNDNIHALISA